MQPIRLARAFAGAVLAVPLLAAADPSYTVTAVAGAGSFAADINNLGQVVGSVSTGNAYHAFLFNGVLTDLGTLGGQNSNAAAINDQGVVVGNSYLSDNSSYLGFTYTGGVMTALPGTNYAQAGGISNAGTIVGSMSVSTPDGDQRHAFSYANGSYTDLGTLPIGDGSRAFAVNIHGDVVGAAANVFNGAPNFPEDPFLYRNGTMTSLGNLGGVFSAATSINDAGQVVGYIGNGLGPNIGDPYPRTAFLYDNGQLTFLTPTDSGVSSWGADINNLGQVVGFTGTGNGEGYAFLYQNGVLTDLNTLIDPLSGWQIEEVGAINDLQQIAATACKDGACYAVRLDLVPAVPEPPVVALLGIGLVLGWRRRRAR